MALVVSLKIAGLLVIFDWSLGALQAVELPKSLWSRTAAWLLVALVALALARYGWRVLPRTRLHLIVVANLVAAGLATAFADNRYLALFGDQNRYLGLTFALDMAILYIASAIAFRGGRDLRLLTGIVAAAAGLVLAYALLQAAGLDPVRWAHDPRGRPFSALGNPDVLGHLISLLLGVAVGVAGFGRELTRPARWAAGAFAVVALGVGSLIATRGTALGVLAIVVLAPVLLARAGGVGVLRSRAALIGGAAVAVALAVVLAVTPLGSRVRDTLGGSGVTADRLVVYETAFDGFRARPILGYGPDSFAIAFALHSPPETARVLSLALANDSAHNWVLHALATTGILGTLALATLAGVQIVASVRLAPRAPALGAAIALGSAAYWAHGLVSVGSVAVDWWPWLGLGLASGLGRGSAAMPPLAPVRRLQPVLASAAIAAAVLAAATGLNALLANQDARSARVVQDVPAALRFAERAVQRDGGRADYWNELGRARFRAQDWTGSARAFEQATSRSPHVARYWSNLALARLRLGPTASEAALEAARRGVSAHPNSPAAHAAAAGVAAQLGDFAGAAAAYRRANELYPSGAAYYRELSDVLDRLGDHAGALAAFQRAIGVASLTDADRLRLAALHRAAGDLARAVQLVKPPKVAAADLACAPASLCLNVRFTSEVPLVLDPADPASVSRPENYQLDGRPLLQAEVQYDPAQLVARIRLPAGSPPARPGLRVRVLNVTNVFGQQLDPDGVDLPR